MTVNGRHYTGYEATQRQRKLERAIRAQKWKIAADEGVGDSEKLAVDKLRLTMLRQEYRQFSRAAGLRMQSDRVFVATKGTPPSVPSALVPAPVKRTTTPIDVHEEYEKNATPGVGEITYDDGYKVGKHREEIETATWLRDTFGGDIRLLKEADGKGVKTPDSIWRNSLWEFKTTQSINGADTNLHKALKQIKENPGGVVLNMTEEVDLARLERQLLSRFKRSKIDGFDLILLSKKQLISVFRYKK